MYKIVIFAPSFLRAKFFYRLYEDILKKHYDVEFITFKKSAYLYLKNKNVKVYDIKKYYIHTFNVPIFFKEKKDEAIIMDVKIGLLNKKNLEKNYYFLIKSFLYFFKDKEYKYFLIFNGNAQYIEYSAKLIANYLNIKTLFFEIGNFPNKIFIDKKGVNATSNLMNINLLDKNKCDLEMFTKYICNYLKNKEIKHNVPQSKVRYPWYFKVLDIDNFEIGVLKRLYNLIYKYFNKKKYNVNYSIINLEEENYVFFPLQVSYDSQILRNSKINLEKAINYAINYAKRKNKLLLVKPHPAENNIILLNYLQQHNVLLTQQNTYLLIKNSDVVITINSTVGLETFFYNKKVIVLGESWYKKYINLDKNLKFKILCNYLNNILVDGDYFNDNIKFSKKILKFLK